MIRLHFKAYGHGHPLIVLHGLFGSLDNWATLCKKLGATYHVFALDARNHGRSPHSAEIDYKVMSDDVHSFILQQGIRHTHLLGHSMGGKTAMSFAFRYPELLGRLVVVDIAPKTYPRKHDPILRALLELNPFSLSTRKEADEVLASSIADPATRQFLLKNLQRSESGHYRWKMNLPSIDRHYDDLRKGFPAGSRTSAPTLFVRGGKSSYILPEDHTQIKAMFPKSTILTIKKAGHWVHADAPAALEAVVKKFLGT